MANADLKRAAEARIDTWERALRAAIEDTHVESERARIQRELVELSTRRDQLEALDDGQLARLRDHLSRDPGAWVRHED